MTPKGEPGGRRHRSASEGKPLHGVDGTRPPRIVFRRQQRGWLRAAGELVCGHRLPDGRSATDGSLSSCKCRDLDLQARLANPSAPSQRTDAVGWHGMAGTFAGHDLRRVPIATASRSVGASARHRRWRCLRRRSSFEAHQRFRSGKAEVRNGDKQENLCHKMHYNPQLQLSGRCLDNWQIRGDEA